MNAAMMNARREMICLQAFLRFYDEDEVDELYGFPMIGCFLSIFTYPT